MASKPAQSKDNRESANRPHEIRLGRLKATIWTNQTETGVRHNTTFCRLYKDGEDWKDSDSFGRDDLLLLAKLADEVHTWIFEQTAQASENGGGQHADRN
jgi:hypothetical protein